MSSQRSLFVVAVALAIAFTGGLLVAHADSNAQPANKMAVAGSALAYDTPGQVATILSGAMKTSGTEDAVITVSMECSIVTQVTTVGNDDSKAFGQVEAWVEVDGAPIAVSADDNAADAGHVVFCDRAHEQTTSGFNVDKNATITTYLSTREANSFSWITLNLPAGTHQFDVKALLTTTSTNNAVAQALIGKRTLVVDPTMLAQNAVI